MPTAKELETLFRSMRRMARAIDIQSHRIDREYGLTLPQLVVLQCVHRTGEATGRAISREAALSPATVVGILDKLELKGLIERHRSGIDRRVVHARLTETGRKLAEAAPAPLGERFATGYRAIAPEQRATIMAAFRQIADLADPPEETPPVTPEA